MRHRLTSIAMALMLLTATGVALAAEVGTVDMERLIRLHPRTVADRQILEQYVEDFESEHEEQVNALRQMSSVFETLREAAEDVGLSEKARLEKRNLAQMKLEEMRQAERELRELAARRQNELTSQELRMRQRVVSDIRKIVKSLAEARQLTLVLDTTTPGTAGYSPVIYAGDALDITEAVVERLAAAPEQE